MYAHIRYMVRYELADVMCNFALDEGYWMRINRRTISEDGGCSSVG